MIIVKFQGALGNQMFEYAFLKSMEKAYPDTRVMAHIEQIQDFNGYELKNVFGLDVPQCTWQEAAIVSEYYPKIGKNYKLLNSLFKLRRYVCGRKDSFIIQDDYTSYYKEVYQLNPIKSYYLNGVWANSKYLNIEKEETLDYFKFPKDINEKNIEYRREMESSESVAIHVRRNEYVTNRLTVVSDNYYRRAVKYILDKLDHPKFFVFSDDHDYCNNLFGNMIDYTMVEGNVIGNSFRDMELMTYCKHNIIANSTFSFWGAYLSKYKNKIIISPDVSYGTCRHPFSCDGWITIKV